MTAGPPSACQRARGAAKWPRITRCPQAPLRAEWQKSQGYTCEGDGGADSPGFGCLPAGGEAPGQRKPEKTPWAGQFGGTMEATATVAQHRRCQCPCRRSRTTALAAGRPPRAVRVRRENNNSGRSDAGAAVWHPTLAAWGYGRLLLVTQLNRQARSPAWLRHSQPCVSCQRSPRVTTPGAGSLARADPAAAPPDAAKLPSRHRHLPHHRARAVIPVLCDAATPSRVLSPSLPLYGSPCCPPPLLVVVPDRAMRALSFFFQLDSGA
ncbi:hypothetical protein VTN96DRAFT_5957 [Rasamsonia emersonii]